MHTNFFLDTLKQNTLNQNLHAPASSQPHLRAHVHSRSRLQSRPQREHPVAVCTRCSAFSFSSSVINQPCDRSRGGNACAGKFASAIAKNAWEKCPTCVATGWQSRMVCSHCQSLGWLFSRKH